LEPPRNPGRFILTENERHVLSRLGDLAWLYRVALDAEGNGKVVRRIPDPMRTLDLGKFRPVAWRVDVDD
jgi:hypothetical protein